MIPTQMRLDLFRKMKCDELILQYNHDHHHHIQHHQQQATEASSSSSINNNNNNNNNNDDELTAHPLAATSTAQHYAQQCKQLLGIKVKVLKPHPEDIQRHLDDHHREEHIERTVNVLRVMITMSMVALAVLLVARSIKRYTATAAAQAQANT